MNKRLLLALLPLLALACGLLIPPPTPAPTPSPIEETAAPTAGADHVVVRIFRTDGDLASLLLDHAQAAANLGLVPVLEFDATWCAPCQAVSASIEEENPLMMKALKGVYLIRADADDWGWENENLSFEAIPVYFKLDADGRPTGDQIDGSAWGKDIPENFAPVLDEFFHR